MEDSGYVWSMGQWIGFNLFLVALLVLDLGVLTRKDHVVGMKEATLVTLLWTAIAGGVAVWMFAFIGTDQGAQYLTAYVVERALSIDNLFVFLVLFSYFRLPREYQARALFFGIIGALLARAVFIALGISVMNAFAPVLFALGGFLVYTAYKLAFSGSHEVDPEKNLALRVARKFTKVSPSYDGHKFFSMSKGVRMATPFLLVVISLGTTDIVFAVDSIPTVLGITRDGFIVWASNAMAVLGMRPLYFLLSGMVALFRYLQYGLAAVLAFVGAKMIFNEAIKQFNLDIHIDEALEIYGSLAIVILMLATSILLSKLIPPKPVLTSPEFVHGTAASHSGAEVPAHPADKPKT
ncbi:MAG: TerC/Alx family metal homeostasis membrane protein [Dehalococcoidia bacterium]|nr:TerC/Alx family metal homeostasis membrane protein [Dehalococcoidia bacterium]